MDHYIISKKEAKENGVNLDMVDVCRQIRNLAKLDRVRLDENIHNENKFNKHLFSYLLYCEVDPKTYIRNYLANLQPYMIKRMPSQEKTEHMICVLDNTYRISLYIKANNEKGNEVIISFHESNKRGVAQENNTFRNTPAYNEQIVPVFGEALGTRIEGSTKEEIKVFIQRGMLVFPIQIMAQECENHVYLVRRGSLEAPIIEQCNQYLRDLYSSNVKLETLDEVEIFSVLQQISFTSYGNSIFSNLTLLIDNMDIQKGPSSKNAADFALTTYLEHLYLTQDQAKELAELLDEKYSVHSSKNYQIVVDRVKDIIAAVADNTPKILESVEHMELEDKMSIIDKHNSDITPSYADGVENVSFRRKGR